MANLGAGLGGGYPVAGSLTATGVRIDAGGRTQVGNLFAGLLSLLTILLLLPAIAHLAFATLSAIVVVALVGLSDLGYSLRLWAVRRCELGVALAASSGCSSSTSCPG